MQARIAYWEKPDQVVWIDLGHRRLQGYDNYWIDWPRYGVFNDEENMGSMYEGLQAAAWEYQGFTLQGGHVEIELVDPTPPEGVTIYRGFMLTDEQARFVGII